MLMKGRWEGGPMEPACAVMQAPLEGISCYFPFSTQSFDGSWTHREMFRCKEFSFLAQKIDLGSKEKLCVRSGEEGLSMEMCPSLKGF